jgi:hypothetical protein
MATLSLVKPKAPKAPKATLSLSKPPKAPTAPKPAAPAKATTAANADFLGGGGPIVPAKKIYPPGEEPNPKNPGGISDNELARRKEAVRIKQAEEHYAKIRKQQSIARGKQIVAEREAWEKTQPGFWERAGADLKVLGPAVLKVAGTTAAVVATGGAAAGAIGVAGLAGITAAAVTADRVINAVGTGQKVVSSLKKGDAAGLAGAAASGLSQAGVKVPALPDAVKKGKEAVASLNLPKVKVDVPDPKKELAAAKKAVSNVKAAVSGAPKAAAATVKAAAPKVAPPKLPPVKIDVPKPAAIPVNTIKQAAAATAKKKLEDQLSALDKARLKLPGAKIVVQKDGKVTVQVPASGTAASALFTPLATGARPLVQSITSSASSAIASLTGVKLPTAAAATTPVKPPPVKPPAMTINQPPPKPPSVASTITGTVAPASAPPAIKPPVANDASSGPTLEGYLVKLDGTIAIGRYRAA